MRILETEITIDAPPQVVWSILDNIEKYPEWNEVLPELIGRTTVGQAVKGILHQGDPVPDIPINPTITRIVGARELRWVGGAPDPEVWRAEHIFIVTPTEDDRTHLQHNEAFSGKILEERWPGINVNLRAAYDRFNVAIKNRAEAMYASTPVLHPALGSSASGTLEGATLRCKCASGPVELTVTEAVSHNHLCGCSKCWKPENAAFAQIAVAPAGTVHDKANTSKLECVDANQKIERYRCKDCGTHMIGRVSDADHHFYGLDFIHPELADGGRQPKIEFAAFVSSLIETGTSPSVTAAIRKTLSKSDVPAYDTFSPELMDIIAWHKVKLEKTGS